MRSLLTGYAGTFNRRHRRRGHLFQNRYKSIVCEEEPYLLELVRYLHLNPLRAGVVEDLPGLDRFAHSGHAALVGRRERPWQDTGEIWARFGGRRRVAQARYRAFVAEGLRHGRRTELQGGGLLRSAGGWAAVRALRRGREAFTADERVLGGSAFVATLLREVDAQGKGRRGGRLRELSAGALITQVCRAVGASDAAVRSHRRTPEICRAREGIAYLWVEVLARSRRRLAEALGIRPESVYKAARRGRLAERRWGSILRGLGKATNAATSPSLCVALVTFLGARANTSHGLNWPLKGRGEHGPPPDPPGRRCPHRGPGRIRLPSRIRLSPNY